MADRDDGDGFDWIEALVKLAALVGLNPVRVRWKLMRLRDRAADQGRAARSRAQHVRYEHKTCFHCGAINDREEMRCTSCGEPLRGRAWHLASRVGLAVPEVLTVSASLAAALASIYLVLALGGERPALWGLDTTTLVRAGGRWGPAVFDGQWWRLGTAVFLHAGLWHIGFNVIALLQIGPAVEELYGRARVLSWFLLTGVLANVVGVVVRPDAVGIGASGAVMGLIGLAAGWGHRDGTGTGRAVRGRMIKWALYVMVFGLFLRADNVAHAVGFASGFALGYRVPPPRRRTAVEPMAISLGVVGAAGALACAVLTLVPRELPAAWAEADRGGWAARAVDWAAGADGDALTMSEDDVIAAYEPWFDICAKLDAGDTRGALLAWPTLGEPYGMSRDAFLSNAEVSCATVDQTRRQCVAFAERGIYALPEPYRTMDGELQREVATRHWSSLCAGLEALARRRGEPLEPAGDRARADLGYGADDDTAWADDDSAGW